MRCRQVHHAARPRQARPAPQCQRPNKRQVVLEDPVVDHPGYRQKRPNRVRLLHEQLPSVHANARQHVAVDGTNRELRFQFKKLSFVQADDQEAVMADLRRFELSLFRPDAHWQSSSFC